MSVGNENGFSINGIRREYGISNMGIRAGNSGCCIEYPTTTRIPINKSVLSSKGMMSTRLSCNQCLIVKPTAVVPQSSEYTVAKGKYCVNHIRPVDVAPPSLVFIPSLDAIGAVDSVIDIVDGSSTFTIDTVSEEYVAPTVDEPLVIEIFTDAQTSDNVVSSTLSMEEGVDTYVSIYFSVYGQ
jgi:hypothetical protein